MTHTTAPFGRPRRGPLHRIPLVALAILLTFAAACGGNGGSGGSGSGSKKVGIGSKGFTEQLLVGEMAAILLENEGFQIDRKLTLNTTQICHQSLTSGEIDLYVEYTGTGLVSVLKQPVQSDPQQVYNTVKQEYESQYKATWLQPWGFNNTYALIMTKERAAELGIRTISDLQGKASQLTLGSDQEFFSRDDGLPGVERTYGIKFKEQRGINSGIVYRAAADKQVDVIVGFSTDGQIPALNLQVLQDDKKFFPPYFAAPVVRQDTLTKYPEISQTLNKLAGKIDDQRMAALNAEVTEQKKEANEVARAYLKSQGLIK